MHMKIKILTILGMCISTSVFAGGYRVALQGQDATGMGHTGVAVTDNSEAVFFNPAGMSFLENNLDLTTGVTLIDSVIKYQNAESNTSAETDNPIGTPLYLYVAQKYTQDFSYGFGFYTPFGNTVEWEKDWPGSHLVNNISLTTMFFQPTVSYKFKDLFSIGVGPTFVNGSVNFNRNLNTSLADANGDRANITIKASNITAWGYNVGFLVKPIKPLALGVSYRSRVDLKARDESANFENIPSSLTAVYADTTFDADLVLPAELTVGMSLNIGNTVLAVDVNRTFWSAYENLDITFKSGIDPSLNPRQYSDVNIYRFGVRHKILNVLTIRAGAYYDESPVSDGYYTPETPRNDSIGLTAGASYEVTKRLGFDVSFLYLIFDEFNGSYDYIGHDDDATTKDTSFGGDYLSSVATIGFGLNYKY